MRRALIAMLIACSATFVGVAPTHAAGSLDVAGYLTHFIGANPPDGPNFTIDTDREGHWVFDAHVEKDGVPVATAPTVHAEGETGSPAGTFDVTLTSEGLTTGAYELVGTVTVTASDGSGDYTGPLHSILDSGKSPTITVDVDAPDGTVSLSRPYFRRNSSGEYDPVSVTSTGTGTDYRYFSVVDAAGTEVNFRPIYSYTAGTWSDLYNGRDSDGLLLPVGSYTLRIVDAARNVGPSVSFKVQQLVLRTYTRTVSATSSRISSSVGRCSTLRSPSSHGWSGSLGYYANTRCRSTATSATTVLTRHRASLPSAASYVDVRIDTSGGASRGYGTSVGALVYEPASATADPAAVVRLSRTVGSHAGDRVAASKVVRSASGKKWVHWDAGTASFNHYDVKSFTLTVRYKVWV